MHREYDTYYHGRANIARLSMVYQVEVRLYMRKMALALVSAALIAALTACGGKENGAAPAATLSPSAKPTASVTPASSGSSPTASSSPSASPSAAASSAPSASASAQPSASAKPAAPSASPAATAASTAAPSPSTAPTAQPATKAPEVQPSASATPKADPAEAAQALFKQSCTGCHGVDLSGKSGPNLQKIGASLSKDKIAEQILNGGSKMPGFKGKLKDDEISSLAEWLAAKK
ncbi:c-type cytochrome [Paenibacillus sp. MBLB4367]|uniref:c-type cytochrome n=1 Tax=Paenibacillus sp. MBLB4367 TaxID=3384767 RepID=UPI0039082459